MVNNFQINPFQKHYGLRPYHPEYARSRLILEAKQGRAWLVLGWEKHYVKCFPGVSDRKELSAMQETWVQSLG